MSYFYKLTAFHMKVFFLSGAFLLFAWLPGFSQQQPMHGSVRNLESKELLPNISVTVAGSSRGTMTNEKGQFSVLASPGETLTFSGVGFATKKVQLGNETTLSISMTPTSKELEAVEVVTALGIRKSARSLGYALTKIDSNQLTNAVASN